jgi:hypothetical protein
MSDLTEFLLARIAEDEAVATDTIGGEVWSASLVSVTFREAGQVIEVVRDGSIQTHRHIAHWHPARVLAECEAKRRIVEWAALAPEAKDDDWFNLDDQTAGHYYGLIDATRILALPYAHHPDFRAEWRVSP